MDIAWAAPLAGVAGVLLGAWLTGVREKHKWLRERRYETYTEFLSMALDADELFKHQLRRAVRAKNGSEAAKLVREYNTLMKGMIAMLHRSDLIGNPKVTAAAAAVALEMGTSVAAAVPTQMSNDQFNEEGWIITGSRHDRPLYDFIVAAARDLGVGWIDVYRRRRHRPLPQRDAASVREQVDLLKKIESGDWR